MQYWRIKIESAINNLRFQFDSLQLFKCKKGLLKYIFSSVILFAFMRRRENHDLNFSIFYMAIYLTDLPTME